MYYRYILNRRKTARHRTRYKVHHRRLRRNPDSKWFQAIALNSGDQVLVKIVKGTPARYKVLLDGDIFTLLKPTVTKVLQSVRDANKKVVWATAAQVQIAEDALQEAIQDKEDANPQVKTEVSKPTGKIPPGMIAGKAKVVTPKALLVVLDDDVDYDPDKAEEEPKTEGEIWFPKSKCYSMKPKDPKKGDYVQFGIPSWLADNVGISLSKKPSSKSDKGLSKGSKVTAMVEGEKITGRIAWIGKDKFTKQTRFGLSVPGEKGLIFVYPDQIKKKNPSKKAKKRTRQRCFLCRKPGHNIGTCHKRGGGNYNRPKFRKLVRKKKKKKAKKRCGQCGDLGHNIRTCTKSKKTIQRHRKKAKKIAGKKRVAGKYNVGHSKTVTAHIYKPLELGVRLGRHELVEASELTGWTSVCGKSSGRSIRWRGTLPKARSKVTCKSCLKWLNSFWAQLTRRRVTM